MQRKLNLGCGFDYLEGFVNADLSPEVNPDVVCSFEKKLPFDDNSFDYIKIKQVMEHVAKLQDFLAEVYRISKPGAIIFVEVPYCYHQTAFSTLTHVNFFSITSFETLNAKNRFHYDTPRVDFEIITRKFRWRLFLRFMNVINSSFFVQKCYQEFLYFIFTPKDIEMEFRVVK